MFKRTKYTSWYNLIIKRAKSRMLDDKEYYEKHHIIPKCIGGKDDNVVLLTAREHYVCHILLTKMFDCSNKKRKMVYALMRMRISNKYHIRNSKQFQYVKKIISKEFSGRKNYFYGKKFLGEKNPFYGKKHSEETRKLLSEAALKNTVGEKNPFYGKKHSEETRKLLSEKRSQKIKVYFFDGKIKTFKNRLELGKYLGKSVYLGAKLLKAEHKSLWSKYNIKEIIKCK